MCVCVCVCVCVPHLSLLSDPVGSGLSLQIVLRVPVGVKDHDGVGRRQIDAEASGARRQEEAEILSAQVEVTHTSHTLHTRFI